MPYCQRQGDKAYYINNTSDAKIVADYTGVTIPQAYDLDVFTFWGYLRDAVIWNCSRTKEGREYLEDAYMYEQDKPDMSALRKAFGGDTDNGRQTD